MFKHKCGNCQTKESNRWRQVFINKEWILLCDNCYMNEVPLNNMKSLTDWQRKKLSFYRDDRKWQEDISGRKVLPGGKIGIYDGHGNLKEIRD